MASSCTTNRRKSHRISWQFVSCGSVHHVSKKKVSASAPCADRRSVRKEDFARRNFFDVWLPELAPSAPLVSWLLSEPITPKRWQVFSRRYRREMHTPAAQRLVALLAALSSQTDFSVGCYCEDENRCHRSLLKQLLIERGAKVI